ncbi:SCO family protein [bacterium]|nr:SCO family protein [bacterium]
MRRLRPTAAFSMAGLLILIGVSRTTVAQESGASAKPDILTTVGIDQRLNENISLDLRFQDETGQTVELREYFSEKPVVLALVYYECPMLCTMILNGILKSLKALKFTVGEEFDVVTVSFDPKETADLAADKKRAYLLKYDRPKAENGWHFLTGDQNSIDALTEAVGFRYEYDEQSKQFVHASGIMVLTPEGTLSRYFYGVEYSPRDLRLGLIEASENKIGSAVDKVLLYCYHYDPSTGKYGLVIMNVIRVLGSATVLLLGTFMVIMFRRDRKVRVAETGSRASSSIE